MKTKKITGLKLALILLCLVLSYTGCDDFPLSPGGQDDASLSALSISTGTLSPDFASVTIDYSVSLAVTETIIAVTPTAANSEATIIVNNTAVASGTASEDISLSPGVNEIEIAVTSQDSSTTKTYTINAVVGGITMSGTLSLPNEEDASGKAVHIGLIKDFEENTDDSLYIDCNWASGCSQDYQFTGVPAGSYYLYALIDWNEDGDFDDSYPDYGGLSGFSFDSLAGMPGGGSPPGDANIIVADSNLTVDIADIQQIPASENGTITISLTDAGDKTGEDFIFNVYEGGVIPTETNHIAEGEGIITAAGTAEVVAKTKGTTDDFIGTGGSSYDIYVLVDDNNSDTPDAGEMFGEYSNKVVSGDTTIAVDYDDLSPYGESGTITVSLINAGSRDGKNFGFAVFISSIPKTEDNYVASGGVTLDSSGTATLVAKTKGTTDDFIADGGTNYDIHAMIDLDDSGTTTSGDDVYMSINNMVDGNITVATDFNDYTTYTAIE